MISYLVCLVESYSYNKTFALINQCNEDLFYFVSDSGEYITCAIHKRYTKIYNHRQLDEDNVIFDLLPRRYRYSNLHL